MAVGSAQNPFKGAYQSLKEKVGPELQNECGYYTEIWLEEVGQPSHPVTGWQKFEDIVPTLGWSIWSGHPLEGDRRWWWWPAWFQGVSRVNALKSSLVWFCDPNLTEPGPRLVLSFLTFPLTEPDLMRLVPTGLDKGVGVLGSTYYITKLLLWTND